MEEIKAPHRKRRKQYLNDNKCYIPQVVQEDILVRLPVKSVARFKSVCKSWHRMIQSRSFRDSYSRRRRHKYSNMLLYSPLSSSIKIFRENPLIEVMMKLTPGPSHLRLPQKVIRLKRPDSGEECKPINEEELLGMNPIAQLFIRLRHSEKQWRRVVRVMGPLNGIYLVVNYYDKGFGIQQGRGILFATSKLALCNPATHDYKYISIFPPHDDSFNPPSYYLGQKQCRVHYGFGRVDTQADYKVIVVIGWGKRFSSFLSFVYSLRCGTWRKLVDYEVGKRHYCDTKAVEGLFPEVEQGGDTDIVRYPEITQDLELCPQRFFKGCWHWMTFQNSNNVYTIMSFDFTDDTFKFMDAPPFHRPCNPSSTLYMEGGGVLVLNDHLAAIFHTPESIQVWVMMEYGVHESWTRIYDVQPKLYRFIDRLVGILSQDDDQGGGGGGGGGGYGIKTIFFHDYRKSLFSCDASGYTKEHGRIDTSSGIWWNSLGISTYLETLEPLDC